MKSLLAKWKLACGSLSLIFAATACHEVVSPIPPTLSKSLPSSGIETRENGRVTLYHGADALVAARRSAAEAARLGDLAPQQFLDSSSLWNAAIRPAFASHARIESSLVASGTVFEELTENWFPKGKIGASSTIPTLTGKVGTVKSAAQFLGTHANTIMKFSAVNDDGSVNVAEQPAEFNARADGADACIGHILGLKPRSLVDPDGWYCHLTGTVRGIATLNVNFSCGVRVKSSATHHAWLEVWLPIFTGGSSSGSLSFSFSFRKFHDSGPTADGQTEAYNGACSPTGDETCTAADQGSLPSSLTVASVKAGDATGPLAFRAFGSPLSALCSQPSGTPGGDAGACLGDGYWQQWFWYSNGEITDEWWESICSSQAAT